ncbi:MAG: transcription antitermination factor NusB [Acidaminococcales bacterium]|jgi:N utilization substance protein B|nr:transcription antitermination factor NusB [Acidaminococcales bacterium]
MSRRLAREMALQTLFQMEFSSIGPKAAFAAVRKEYADNMEESSVDYATSLVTGVSRRRKALTGLVAKYAKGWDVLRIANVDMTILRICIYEIYFSRERIDTGIAINEAVEIAKIYGDNDSPRFINGILGNMVKTLDMKKACADVPGD